MSVMIKVLCTIFLVCAVSSYNFDDGAYNQLLARDLQDFYQYQPGLAMHRSRRDADENVERMGKRFLPKFQICCAEDVFKRQFNSSRLECFKEVRERFKEDHIDKHEVDPFRCVRPARHRKYISCVAECVAKKDGLLNDEGVLDKEEVTKMLKEKMSSELWFDKVGDGIITKCLEKANGITRSLNADDCNPAFIALSGCFFREVQMSCPVEEIKDTDVCSRMRQRFEMYDKLKENDM